MTSANGATASAAAGESSRYLMEDDREAARLAKKVDAAAWARSMRATWSPAIDEARVSGQPFRILDVGCGPGHLARALADEINGAEVVGVDASRRRLAAASQHKRVTLHHARADRLPFDKGRFDAVFARFLLEYLPEREAAVREMVRVLRPGGALCLQDLDGHNTWLHPTDPEMEGEIQALLDGLAAGGFDPLVGRKLYTMAVDAGVVGVWRGTPDVSIEPYRLIAGEADANERDLLRLKLEILRPKGVEAMGGDAIRYRRPAAFLERAFSDPRSLTFSLLFTVHGRKPLLARGEA